LYLIHKRYWRGATLPILPYMHAWKCHRET
jgi:hypothetical protein